MYVCANVRMLKDATCQTFTYHGGSSDMMSGFLMLVSGVDSTESTTM